MLREIAVTQLSALPLLGPWLWGHGVSKPVPHRPVRLPTVGPMGMVNSADPRHSHCISPVTRPTQPSSPLTLSLPDRAPSVSYTS